VSLILGTLVDCIGCLQSASATISEAWQRLLLSPGQEHGVYPEVLASITRLDISRLCLLLFTGFLRFSVLCPLFIDNSRGYLLFTTRITSFLLELRFQLLIFLFSFRACSSRHNQSPFRIPFAQCERTGCHDFERRSNSPRNRLNTAASSGFNSCNRSEISESALIRSV
jgi:hypothetical protein